MTPMKQHVSILGILYTVFGALGLLGAVLMLFLFGGLAGIVSVAAKGDDAAIAAPILGVLAVVFFVALLVFSIPGLVVGIGLLKLQPWARIGGLVLSAVNLFNFPIGTALGAYGLWVLMSKDTEPLFE